VRENKGRIRLISTYTTVPCCHKENVKFSF